LDIWLVPFNLDHDGGSPERMALVTNSDIISTAASRTTAQRAR
jgi:hypothetical protein